MRAGSLSQLDVARFAKKYPAVMTALLRSLLEVTVKYYKALLGCALCCCSTLLCNHLDQNLLSIPAMSVIGPCA